MELLIIRHAIAEDREAFAKSGEPDERRPLTAKGRKKMRIAATGLRQVVPGIDALYTSPLIRAAETAAIVGKSLDVRPHALDELRPGVSPQKIVETLTGKGRDDQLVGIVGHEPDLSQLVGWLLTGKARSVIELKKGAACLVRVSTEPSARGIMTWALSPRQLRRLAR